MKIIGFFLAFLSSSHISSKASVGTRPSQCTELIQVYP
jgi:hypothetical protein